MAKDKPQPQAGPELAEYTTAAQPKAYADGVPVFCAHDAIVPLKDLRPNPKNPNQHPPEQIKLLASIIRATGWRGPITVSKRSGYIVKGHGRMMAAEPGDMASAARTVYQISIMDPKWVRAYVSETQLKYVQEGAEALVTTDTTEPLKARVGHISSEAEFTPKTVATQDLRTVLVYEVRLNVEDPGNRLRLGQPVTVDFAP